MTRFSISKDIKLVLNFSVKLVSENGVSPETRKEIEQKYQKACDEIYKILTDTEYDESSFDIYDNLMSSRHKN